MCASKFPSPPANVYTSSSSSSRSSRNAPNAQPPTAPCAAVYSCSWACLLLTGRVLVLTHHRRCLHSDDRFTAGSELRVGLFVRLSARIWRGAAAFCRRLFAPRSASYSSRKCTCQNKQFWHPLGPCLKASFVPIFVTGALISIAQHQQYLSFWFWIWLLLCYSHLVFP